MFEFLIEWLDEEPKMGDNYREILRPNTVSSRPIEGAEVYAIDVNGCVFYFSWEMVGIQVTLSETCLLSAEEAQRIVEEIRDNIVKATGVQADVLRFDADDTNVYAFMLPDVS
jgi:hypothetical protein